MPCIITFDNEYSMQLLVIIQALTVSTLINCDTHPLFYFELDFCHPMSPANLKIFATTHAWQT